MSEVMESVFDYIVQYKFRNDGVAPSFQEIMDACDVTSKSMIYYYLDKLEEDGRIVRPAKKSPRNIQIVGGCWQFAVASR